MHGRGARRPAETASQVRSDRREPPSDRGARGEADTVGWVNRVAVSRDVLPSASRSEGPSGSNGALSVEANARAIPQRQPEWSRR